MYETPPQHFRPPQYFNSSSDLYLEGGEYFPGALEASCSSFNDIFRARASSSNNNLYQRQNLHIPIVRLWNVSATEAATHVGKSPKTEDGTTFHFDCTHFCQTSSLLSLWQDLIYNAVINLDDL